MHYINRYSIDYIRIDYSIINGYKLASITIYAKINIIYLKILDNNFHLNAYNYYFNFSI